METRTCEFTYKARNGKRLKRVREISADKIATPGQRAKLVSLMSTMGNLVNWSIPTD